MVRHVTELGTGLAHGSRPTRRVASSRFGLSPIYNSLDTLKMAHQSRYTHQGYQKVYGLTGAEHDHWRFVDAPGTPIEREGQPSTRIGMYSDLSTF
jgi:hypothetical protein